MNGVAFAGNRGWSCARLPTRAVLEGCSEEHTWQRPQSPSRPTSSKIAVIPGDGIGNEVVPEGIRVLEAVGARFGIDYAWDHSTGRASASPRPAP